MSRLIPLTPGLYVLHVSMAFNATSASRVFFFFYLHWRRRGVVVSRQKKPFTRSALGNKQLERKSVIIDCGEKILPPRSDSKTPLERNFSLVLLPGGFPSKRINTRF